MFKEMLLPLNFQNRKNIFKPSFSFLEIADTRSDRLKKEKLKKKKNYDLIQSVI